MINKLFKKKIESMFISTKTGLFQVTSDLQDCIVIVICTCIGVKKEFP